MLVKITNFCSMGCSHCMEDSTRAGSHMTEDTFERTLIFSARIESLARKLGVPPLVLLSGGECTEHPKIEWFIARVMLGGGHPVLITNGAWLADRAKRESLLRPEWPRLFIQVTNDPRYYPTGITRVDDPRLHYVEAVGNLLPLGRGARRSLEGGRMRAPSSFNLRSLARATGSIEQAIAVLRARSAAGLSGQCTPNVTEAGDVMAGESRNCFKIGTIDSPFNELTRALCEMRCNACGLVDNLSDAQKQAIGEL